MNVEFTILITRDYSFEQKIRLLSVFDKFIYKVIVLNKNTKVIEVKRRLNGLLGGFGDIIHNTSICYGS